MIPRLRIGSVFSGIGGLDLGVEWTGLGDVLYHVELDAYARRVLRARAKECVILDDVRLCGQGRTHGRLPYADIIIGGSPCQGFSQSGDRRGFDDPRSALWFEMRRLIEENVPAGVLFENVIELTRSVGGERPAIYTIENDLRTLGYAHTEPFVLSSHDLLDSGGFPAPQRRCRVFIAAVKYHKKPERLPNSTRPLSTIVDDLPIPALRPLPVFRWPAPRQKERGAFEPRRVIPKATRYPGTHKRIRLHALGNAVMPAMGYAAACVLRSRLLGLPTNVVGVTADAARPSQRSHDKNDWPTPVTTDCKGARRQTARTEAWTSNPGTTLTDAVWLADPADYGAPLNPSWVEILMGFPLGWTYVPEDVPGDTLTTGPKP